MSRFFSKRVLAFAGFSYSINNSTSSKDTDIVVIGGGIAGYKYICITILYGFIYNPYTEHQLHISCRNIVTILI